MGQATTLAISRGGPEPLTTPPLRGKVVTLRAPEPRDVDLLNQWANDPDLWRLLTGWHFPYSRLSTERWVATHREREGADHQVLCIEAPDVGLVGTTGLDRIDWKNRSATFGLQIGPTAARGKGYALDASFLMLRLAFEHLGLNRLDGPIIAYNTRSIRMYTEKCGFRQEGVRRQAHFRDGRFHDEVLLGITKDDYRGLLASTRYWD